MLKQTRVVVGKSKGIKTSGVTPPSERQSLVSFSSSSLRSSSEKVLSPLPDNLQGQEWPLFHQILAC